MDCHFVTKTFLGERWVLPTCKKGTLGTPFCSYKMGLPTPRVQSERGSFYTHTRFRICPASLMETHPRFPMCSGPKMETHTRFHVILLFFGRNTCVLPICKGNTFKVSLKIGIIIVEVETHFIYIASFHATGCFECGNTCAFP